MEKGRIEFAISFLERGGNSEQSDNFQIFLGANAPLGPASSVGLYVCLYICNILAPLLFPPILSP